MRAKAHKQEDWTLSIFVSAGATQNLTKVRRRGVVVASSWRRRDVVPPTLVLPSPFRYFQSRITHQRWSLNELSFQFACPGRVINEMIADRDVRVVQERHSS